MGGMTMGEGHIERPAETKVMARASARIRSAPMWPHSASPEQRQSRTL